MLLKICLTISIALHVYSYFNKTNITSSLTREDEMKLDELNCSFLLL